MSLRDILQGIYDQHGELTTALVLDEARDENHPLHNRFEWDDAAAGEQWRHGQAAELIRSVKVVYKEATEKEEERTVRAYHAVRSPKGFAYQPAEKVAEDPLMRRMLLADMQRDWQDLKRRYQRFAEFADMVRADLEEAA